MKRFAIKGLAALAAVVALCMFFSGTMKTLSTAKVKIVTRIYEKMKISDRVRADVAAYSSKAVAALKSTSLSDEAKEPYRKLVDKLTGRRK